MRPFDYIAPHSLKEAAAVLAQASGAVRPIVGGTDLIAQMKEGKVLPSLVLDMKRIPEMLHLEYVDGDGLRIGAAVSCTDVASYSVTQERYPALAQSCQLVGSTQIQNRASVGGNVCNAAPSADTVPPLLIYEATCIIIGPSGERRVPLEDFFVGPGSTVLASQELLVSLVLPPPPPNSSSSYLRLIPREEMDIAVVGVGSLVAIDATSGHCSRARIALAAVAPTPRRARDAEAVLQGQILSDATLDAAGEKAANAAQPISDVRGTAEYRRELVKVLTRRTLKKSINALQS